MTKNPQNPNLQQQPGSLPPSSTFEAQPTRRRSSSMGMYGVQVSSGAPQIQHQRMMVGGLMSPGANINPQPGQMQFFDDQTGLRQMISPAIQNMGLTHGMQIQHSNLTKDTFQGRQTTGVMNHHGLNPQLGESVPNLFGHQPLTHEQMCRQKLSQQETLTYPQVLLGQNLRRTPSLASINPQLSALAQNGQSTVEQQWLNQQRQQHAFLLRKLSESQTRLNSLSLNRQQLQQRRLLLSQIHQHQLYQEQLYQFLSIQQQQQQQQHQQLFSRKPESTVEGSIRMTGPQHPASFVTNGVSPIQGTEASNQLLGKRKIQDLVSEVDPLAKLDEDVQAHLLDMSDDFIDSVTSSMCDLAKHRKSSIVELKDLLLVLEKNWHLKIPGYSRDHRIHQRDSLGTDEHKKRQEVVRSLMESEQSKRDTEGVASKRRL